MLRSRIGETLSFFPPPSPFFLFLPLSHLPGMGTEECEGVRKRKRDPPPPPHPYSMGQEFKGVSGRRMGKNWTLPLYPPPLSFFSLPQNYLEATLLNFYLRKIEGIKEE